MRRAALLRLVLLTLLTVAVPSFAAAEPVPMCGELGQSIEAPPPIYPGREATLGQAHCAKQGSTSSWEGMASLPPQVDDSRTTDVPLGYLVGERLPRLARTRLPMPPAADMHLPSGVRRQVERPPRNANAALR